MLKMSFAMDRSDFNAIHPTTCVGLFHLPIGQPLAPARHRTTPLPCGRVPMAEHLQEGRLIAGKGICENRRQVPCSKTSVGILHQSQGLIIGPLAHHQGHHQLAVSDHGGMIPPVTSFTQFVIGAAFLLFFTKLHGSSNSNAMGLRARTCSS